MTCQLKTSDKKATVIWTRYTRKDTYVGMEVIEPFFLLLRDTQIIKESKDIQMTFDGMTARLSIKSARSEMSGTYKCQIVNEHGKEESTAELTVISKNNKLQNVVRL